MLYRGELLRLASGQNLDSEKFSLPVLLNVEGMDLGLAIVGGNSGIRYTVVG